ncbi:ATP-binding protein [Streptomyces sp. NPDC006475]|uniref:ATP-binding protein n=1 Tax=Streptomyces sp. NPDC006475 TaxID=3155719 RepID=UPI0033AD3E57
MKQSAVKTLGAAALGAAFAAAAAGSAAAAPATLPDTATPLDSVTSVAPVQKAVTKLPAGAPESLVGGQQALTEAAGPLAATLEGVTNKALPTDGAADPVAGLLGGLPIAGALPLDGLPLDGLPLDGLPLGGLPLGGLPLG